MPSHSWSASDTWQKLAFIYLGDESRYREFFDVNPGFSPLSSPSAGQKIKIPDSFTNNVVVVNDRNDSYYFPWSNPQDYYNRLLKYTALSLFLKKDINGVYTL